MLPLQKEKALPGSRFASPEVSFSLSCALPGLTTEASPASGRKQGCEGKNTFASFLHSLVDSFCLFL
jgi:hypothetical protein